MQEEPHVSVVMPAYNAERYIGQAIQSVLRQTYPDFELLVVDDGSKDQTVRIVRCLAEQDDRIHLYIMGKNSGVSASRNFGVTQARGEWIAFLDSDDIWREDKLERQLSYLARFPSAAIGYTASAFMNADGERYAYIMAALPQTTYAMLLRGNLMSCSSVMVKTSLMRRYPMGGDQMHEDYAAWLQILREVPCAYGVNEPLLIYRVSSASKSGDRITSAEMLYHTYRYVGFSAARALCMVFRYVFCSVDKRRKIGVYH